MFEDIVKIENKTERLDAYLITKLDKSRSQIQKLIDSEDVLINGMPTKNGYRLKENDVITINETETISLDAKPEKMDLDIIFEDNDVIVVNKPNGMVVHPAIGNPSGTLVNGLAYHSNQLSHKNGAFRPGIVHRIDAYTTGLLVVAKNDKAHETLAKQLEEKSASRKYIALVWGVINNDSGTIDAPIGRDANDRKKMTVVSGGKNAITHFRVLERYANATLIELKLETGRTHQIRVHMNYIGFPIVNDPVYGRRKLVNSMGQCLHAMTLGFVHPTTNEYMEFSSPIPEKFNTIVNLVKNS